jgi:hypothetical protein
MTKRSLAMAIFVAMTLAIISLFYFSRNNSESTVAGRGCCSYHGGQCGCRGGSVVCCDGSFSPSCECNMDSPSETVATCEMAK